MCRSQIQRRHRLRVRLRAATDEATVARLRETNKQLRTRYQELTQTLVCSRCGRAVLAQEAHQCPGLELEPSWQAVALASIAGAASSAVLESWEGLRLGCQLAREAGQAVARLQEGLGIRWGAVAGLCGDLAQGWVRFLRQCR